eukprot:m.66820 g.66820  ORF g.66820 m.66820 type:complete len:345 (-) comp13611_c0_seq1:167-1201(-)
MYPCAGVVAVNSKWEIALVFNALGHTSFPKGRREEGETEEQCAVRELLEETGLVVTPEQFEPHLAFRELYPDTKQPLCVYFTWILEDTASSSSSSSDAPPIPLKPAPGDEEVEARWVPIDQVSSLDWKPGRLSTVNTILQYLRTRRFIQQTCEGRPPSHGESHMVEVAALARRLVTEDARQDLLHLVNLGALLHDVADHKYDNEHLNLEDLVRNFTRDVLELPWLLTVAQTVSYSREVKLGREVLLAQLPDAQAIQVRNYVSDADKLLALGHIGFERMRQYTEEVSPNATEVQNFSRCYQHCLEKIFQLHEFIHTPTAQQLALKERDIFKDDMLKWAAVLLSEH